MLEREDPVKSKPYVNRRMASFAVVVGLMSLAGAASSQGLGGGESFAKLLQDAETAVSLGVIPLTSVEFLLTMRSISLSNNRTISQSTTENEMEV